MTGTQKQRMRQMLNRKGRSRVLNTFTGVKTLSLDMYPVIKWNHASIRVRVCFASPKAQSAGAQAETTLSVQSSRPCCHVHCVLRLYIVSGRY
jgi:hypothetical protein